MTVQGGGGEDQSNCDDQLSTSWRGPSLQQVRRSLRSAVQEDQTGQQSVGVRDGPQQGGVRDGAQQGGNNIARATLLKS